MSDSNNNYTQSTGEYNPQDFGYSSVSEPEQKRMSIASLVLGICGLFAWCLPPIGYPVTIVGIILGVIGMKKGGKGMAVAGVVCAAIGLVLTVINSVAGALYWHQLMNSIYQNDL